MNALEVIIRDREHIVGYACETCGVFYVAPKRSLFGFICGYRHVHQMDEADRCCTKHYCKCGNGVELSRSMSMCDDCERAERELVLNEKLKRTIEKARRVSESDYEGPIVWPNPPKGRGIVSDMTTDDGDIFMFSSTAALREACAEAGVDVPLVVFACTTQSLALSGPDIVRDALESMELSAEEWEQKISNEQDDALQTFLTAWCGWVNLEAHYEDRTRVVMLDREVSP